MPSDTHVQRWFHIGMATHWLRAMTHQKKALQITPKPPRAAWQTSCLKPVLVVISLVLYVTTNKLCAGKHIFFPDTLIGKLSKLTAAGYWLTQGGLPRSVCGVCPYGHVWITQRIKNSQSYTLGLYQQCVHLNNMFLMRPEMAVPRFP